MSAIRPLAMPIEIERLKRSKTWLHLKKSPEDRYLAFHFLNLWLAAYPDGIEDDDEVLADLAMCEPEKWTTIRPLMIRGWRKESGRLFHPVVQEVAAREAKVETKTSRRQAGAPSTGNPKAIEYHPEFQEFWAEYVAGKLGQPGSKSEAYEVWLQEPIARPPQPVLMACLRAYKASLTAKKGDPTPACHPVRWLRRAYWEPFLEESMKASVAEQDISRARQAWNGKAQPLVDQIGDAKFVAWFKSSSIFCRKDGKGGVHIAVPTQFVRRWIEGHFAKELTKAFGEWTIEALTN